MIQYKPIIKPGTTEILPIFYLAGLQHTEVEGQDNKPDSP